MVFLPGLVASLIFRHAVSDLDPRQAVETLTNFSLVCKHWQHLIECDEAEDGRLWRPIAQLLSPAFPHDLADLSYWDGGLKPSWRAACKLHCGWSKAFLAPIPLSKVHPHLCEELCEVHFNLPPVARSCHRAFVLAVTAPLCESPFFIQQRLSAHLPQLDNSLVAFDSRSPQLGVLTHDGGLLHLECAKLFPGMDGHCEVSSHRLKALHIRKVDISHLQAIFAASQEGLLMFDDDDSEDVIRDDDDDGQCSTTGDDKATFASNDDIATSNASHAQGLEQDLVNARIENTGTVNTEDVFVIHNVRKDLTCDIWVVHNEPYFCTYWQKLLLYCPKSVREIITCVEAGINGVQLWCRDINATCLHMEANSQYVAVLGHPDDTRLLLLSIQTGETLQFVDTEFSLTKGMLLTDTCVVVNALDSLTVFQLPTLEALYVLPYPNGEDPAMLGFMALSPCGKYLGVVAGFGSFVLYDMLLGNIKYFGWNGVDFPKEGKRQLGDGVWLWYKDVKSEADFDGCRKEETEKILFWELTEPDIEYYDRLARVCCRMGEILEKWRLSGNVAVEG